MNFKDSSQWVELFEGIMYTVEEGKVETKGKNYIGPHRSVSHIEGQRYQLGLVSSVDLKSNTKRVFGPQRSQSTRHVKQYFVGPKENFFLPLPRTNLQKNKNSVKCCLEESNWLKHLQKCIAKVETFLLVGSQGYRPQSTFYLPYSDWFWWLKTPNLWFNW